MDDLFNNIFNYFDPALYPSLTTNTTGMNIYEPYTEGIHTYTPYINDFPVPLPGTGTDDLVYRPNSVTVHADKIVMRPQNAVPEIKDVIFNPPATIVLWKDGTKTVVKCGHGDTYSKEVGLAMAICKKAYGNKGAYNNVFNKWLSK